jgi:hypothetical protein
MKMDRKAAAKEWRDVTRGAPEGVPTGHTVHAFAQRVEALAIAGCDKRHAVVRTVGGALSNLAYNLAQRTGQPLSNHDTELLDRLRREWDAALKA